MSAARSIRPGERRTCPHCRTIMLASQPVCPLCTHHVTYASGQDPRTTHMPLKIEGTVGTDSNEPVEYMVTLTVCDERGREIDRQVVGVGAISAANGRTIRLTVETYEQPDKR